MPVEDVLAKIAKGHNREDGIGLQHQHWAALCSPHFFDIYSSGLQVSLQYIYPRVVHASTSTPEGKASDKIDEWFVFLFEQIKKPDADFEQI